MLRKKKIIYSFKATAFPMIVFFWASVHHMMLPETAIPSVAFMLKLPHRPALIPGAWFKSPKALCKWFIY